jgi:hypothetical protein
VTVGATARADDDLDEPERARLLGARPAAARRMAPMSIASSGRGGLQAQA